ncbi:uncharacterized protein KY384_002689 [Bacidia gigantensis]|uniref:uncharacterized protein n=1 Tax=Bacidia gigantensis TaxID=2732470 RepID=UPI001D057274|nr:uncharacterized protein KY384_002689 [Bacidia gigantensis]KAG8532811.1 hypothetical protein KY384_002689 [Bacidia gigantensis]
MAKPGSSSPGDIQNEKSPPNVPETSKRKPSRSKKTINGLPSRDATMTRAHIQVDSENAGQPSSSSGKRSKKTSTRKMEDTTLKENLETPKQPSKAPPEPVKAESTSEEDMSAHHQPHEEEDDDGLPDPFRSSLLGPGRPHVSMSETLRQLSGYVSGVSQKLRNILENLRQKSDPSVQLIALQELSELLLISNEDSLSGHFSPDQFAKELISLMQPSDFGEENPEMMLLACRCIANMMEALPASTAVVVYSGAVPILCAKLLEIDFIDLAEQALSTLEKISIEFPSSIVREGGLSACLNFLDFFATSTQRTAVTTAANCCKNIPQDTFSVISDVMPTLLNVLSNSDQKVVEQGSICVSRIVESFKYENEKLESLVSVDLLKAVRRLLQPGTTNLIGPNIHTQFLRVLSITARASPNRSAELLKMGIVETLYQILTGVSPPNSLDNAASEIDSVFIMQALIHRPREQITETLNVICELLPPVQLESLSFSDTLPDAFLLDDDIIPYSGSTVKNKENQDRLKQLDRCKEELKRFAIIMFPTLTDAFSSTVNLGVRQKVLVAHLKMLSNLDVSILEEALRIVPYASFLASILSQKDHPSLVGAALKAADVLLNRLLMVYGYQFYREGVMAEISKLASEEIAMPELKMPNAINGRDTKEVKKEPLAETETVSRDNGGTETDELRNNRDTDLPIEVDEDDDQDDDEDEAREIPDDVSPSPSDSSSEQDYFAPSASEYDLNVLSARKFLEVHESSKAKTMKERAAKILKQLQSLAKSISRHYLVDGHGDGPKLFKQLSESFQGDALSTVTSAELLQSDVVDTLLDIFGNPEDQIRIRARYDFVQTFMVAPSRSSKAPSTASPFSVFIHKLQDLLSRAEHFEVITIHQNAFDNNRSSPYSMLSKQLRLRLAGDDEAEVSRSYSSLTISVHAIATFKSLDDYLRPRISLAERPRSSRHREGVSNALAAVAAAAGYPAPHPRFTNRLEEPSDPSAQSSPADGPSVNRSTRKSAKSKKGDHASEPASETSKTNPARRSSRKKPVSAPETFENPLPPPERVQTPLECADEHQLTEDEEDPENSSALDAIVDDLEESMDAEQGPEPTAINMEVASTGKVTARKDDGTRVATPSHNPSTPHPAPPHRTPVSFARDLSPNISLSAARRAMSYAAAIQSTPQDWHIEFSIDGRPVPHDMTIYRAVHYDDLQPNSTSSRNIWSAVHTVKFKKVQGPPPAEASLSRSSSTLVKGDANSSLPLSLHEHPQTSKILRLLNIFHEMNANLEDVLDENVEEGLIKAEALSQFVNTKLTAKLNRQLEEPLIVASSCLPSWSEDLACLYPFLFPFETRHLFLQSTSFGYSRSMARWQNQSTEESRRDRHRDDRPFMGKLQRQKVRIQRSRILESACKVMEMYGGSSSILEIEYFDEVGTGLGPTLEFYSTVSKEFSKKKTKLWRTSDVNEQEEYAFSNNGMFPAPMTDSTAQSESGKKMLYYFKMLGKFVARSMLDSRIIDVSLNPILFRVGGQSDTVPLSLGAVKHVDSHLANSLWLLKQYVNTKKQIDSNPRLTATQKNRESHRVTINDASIEDLSLDFTLPGYPNIDLVENGSSTPVTIDNVAMYIEKVVDMTLGIGVQRQIEQFRSGFSEVFSYSALKAFTPSELVMLFGRIEEDWSIETLCDSIKADHGYNMDSKSVRNLLQVMSELSPQQRRDFLQFVTGSPKLPIGGFKSLNPMFTVVCKPSEAPYTSDDFLLSVMTCANYVKLPDYTNLDVLRKRLLTAITEGQGAFHLS